ncbi:gamma-glutamyltranspeptidase [Stachybotrys elegans]|uniref:Glutathione hydrolase n=1 Tax=Stachybotrys elegans TaxID=80388 RepID=A0A8K0SUN7_9HYPO|nr:gamma-glutamyltranspeptidase [Stachybotrys elegans]
MACRALSAALAAALLAVSCIRPVSGAYINKDSDDGYEYPEIVLEPQPGSRGAVASEAIECSAIGRDLLARGGNAADALVGTTFCVGVIGMYHSGIGGGGFALVRGSDGNFEAIDFRESAPAAASENMYQGNVHGSVYGGLSAGVPGEVRGLEYIHTKYGELPWETVLAGAIHVARTGFKVSHDLVRYMGFALNMSETNFLTQEPWAEDFAPNGVLVKEGDIMTRKRYANMLERIAEQGADAFYSGEFAESMIATIQETNGTMTLEDLQQYQVKSRNVPTISYRGLQLHGVGSPAGGAVGFSILKTMEQYDTADWADLGLSYHRFDESMRFAYGARLELGDPSFVDRIDELEAEMLSDDTAEQIRARILDNQTQPVEHYDPRMIYTSESHGTSHIVTTDHSGMATSLTTTINLLFGAQIMDPLTGVIINNEMNDFSIPGVRNEFGFVPSEANYIRPHKRPLSSITPVIAVYPNGTLFATVGAAGGSRIISSTAQVIWHVLEHEMTMTEALAQPRIHDQLMPNYAMVEYIFDNATVDSLRDRGHDITYVRQGLSAVQGIRRMGDGAFEAASEPRQSNSGGLTV